MSEATNFDTRNPEVLTPHPKNDEIYGDEAPDWFVESVAEKGIREPLVVTEETHFGDEVDGEEGEVIISGHRRVEAAKKVGLDEVPIRFEEYPSELEEREALIEYNKQREKTFSQKMREAEELMEVEEKRARQRMKKGGEGNQDLGDPAKGQTLDKVAKTFDRSGEWLRQARKVWEYAQDGHTWAQRHVEAIESGDGSVNSAYKAVQRREKLEEIDEEGPLGMVSDRDREPEGELLASFTTSPERLQKLLRQSALNGETGHDELCLEVRAEGNGEVRVLQSTPGEVVSTYCSFYTPYIDEISLEEEPPIVVITDVEEMYSRIDSIGGDVVRVELRGDNQESVAFGIRLVGEYETWIATQNSEVELDNIPTWMPKRFTDQNVYTNKEGDQAPTLIDTEVNEVEKIIWAVTNTDTTDDFYPIIVEDEEFHLNVEGEDSYLRGLLLATVEGPDIENYYFDGFEEIFNVLSGAVELQTAPGNNPIAIVQEEHGKVIRHINGPITSHDSK